MRIWKFELSITDVQEVDIPFPARVLSVGNQRDELVLWALVDPDDELMTVKIRIVGTGNPFDFELFDDARQAKFIGTVLMGNGLVWHVFEERI